MNVHGAIKYEMSKEKWLDSIFNLEEGMTYDIKELTLKLEKIGYKHTFSTNTTGEYSSNTGIFAVYLYFSISFSKLEFARFVVTIICFKNCLT